MDDFGSIYPVTLAVCTTEARAIEIGLHLWGNEGPGLPEGIVIDKIRADVFLDGE